MPPCPISSPPPTLALALPWEVPGRYAFVLALAVLFSFIVRRLYVKAVKPLTRRTRVGFVLVIATAASIVAGIGCLWLVFVPYVDHIVTWSSASTGLVDGQSCSLNAHDALVQRLLEADNAWERGMSAFLSCALVVNGIALQLIRPAMRRQAAETSGA